MSSCPQFDPPQGVAEDLGEDIRRILAPNPSPMTWRGTNTYLVGTRVLAVIDPGPDDTAHLQAILDALEPGQGISHILVTHAHRDHSPLARPLARETGAPVLAYGPADAGRSAIMRSLGTAGLTGGGEGIDTKFVPDIPLADGATIRGDGWAITAHWTPGHFGNHMCFSLGTTVFTGDLVMGWASSLVSPPDGDLSDYRASCRKLGKLGARVFHSGHGAPIRDPKARLDWLLSHRTARETAILDHLDDGPATARTLARTIYTDIPADMLPAAERNVFAHLIDLYGKGRLLPLQTLSIEAQFARP